MSTSHQPIQLDTIQMRNPTLFSDTPWDPKMFHEMIERFHQPLHRYYAVHTGGELLHAYEMTVRTFAIVYQRPAPFAQPTFISWLFGMAWDVLNAHYSRSDHQDQAGTFAVPERTLRPHHVEMLRTLRSLAFYPRECLYLRFFAGLAVKDIGILMDKSKSSIKILVYQALTDFSMRLNGREHGVLPRAQLLSLAQAYHLYLNETRLGISSQREIPVDVMQATGQLNVLRTVVTMGPELRAQLGSHVEQMIRSGNPLVTRL